VATRWNWLGQTQWPAGQWAAISHSRRHEDLANGHPRLQLAKGAIAAGLELLLRPMGARRSRNCHACIWRARSATTSPPRARRIGLLIFLKSKFSTPGNTGCSAQKLALSAATITKRIWELRKKTPPTFRCKRTAVQETVRGADDFSRSSLSRRASFVLNCVQAIWRRRCSSPPGSLMHINETLPLPCKKMGSE